MGTSAEMSPVEEQTAFVHAADNNSKSNSFSRTHSHSSSSSAMTRATSDTSAPASAVRAHPHPPASAPSHQHHALASSSSSNVTAEMRRRGATSTHRGSLPSAFPSSSSSSSAAMFGVPNSSSSSRNGRLGASRAMAAAPIVLDRRLLQKYEEVNSEIQRLTRLSRLEQHPTALPPSASSGEDQTMLIQVNAELRKARRSSSKAIQSQKELLDKLERQEKGGFRRFFSMNKESKVEKIKSKLCDKLSESAQVDEELHRLERKSDALARTSLASSFNHGGNQLNASYSHAASYNYFTSLQSISEVQEEIASLEREKEDILNNLFSAINNPDVQDLHSRIAMYSSEMKACESIMKQVDRCAGMYRQALHLLSVALATVVSPHYTGTVKEFTQGPYPLAVEASHLIEQASHGIQPESRRRYRDYAPELVGVHPPKFPQAVADYARRARANMDPNSSLSLEAMRKLRNAENVLMLLQRLVIEKSAMIDQWKKHVEQDQEQGERAHEKLEQRLQEQVAVLARSASV